MRERLVHQTKEVIRFVRFTDFIHAARPEGLGADLPTIKRLCSDDPEALGLTGSGDGGEAGRTGGQ